MNQRGETAHNFEVSSEFNDVWEKPSRNQFLIWNREILQSENTVLLITATNNFFTEEVKAKTRYAFTLIIPHPVTEYDTIFTAIKNF